jgi:hypothetical protein
MVASATQNMIVPAQGETEEAFIYRAHYALMASIPDPDTRNQVVWDAWDSAHGNAYRDRAVRYFNENYRHVPSVCIFYEHSTTGRDGSEHKYTFRELADIARNQNRRTDTNCYSAIASHHTSDFAKGPDKEPKAIGYAGVFRMGMVDPEQPKWGIFADEFHRNDASRIFDDRRRRSVEVLRFKDGRTPVLDPIATLGVDSPRLNLPVARYEAEEGAEIERYSFMSSFAAVGPNSSYIPKTEYGFNDSASDNEPQGSAMGNRIGPDDVKAILDALRALPEMKFIREQMQGGMGGMQPPAPVGPPSASPQPDPTPMGAPTPGVPDVPPPGSEMKVPMGGPMSSGMGNPMQMGMNPKQPYGASPLMPSQSSNYSGESDEVEKERYEALEAENASLREKYSEVVSRCETLSDSNKRIMQDLAQQRQAVASIQRKACDADRKDLINELCEKYSDLADREALYSKCLYSHNSEMDNESFVNYIEMLEETYSTVRAKQPTSMGMIPQGVTPQEASEQERYSAIMDRFSMALPGDADLDYDQLEAKLVSEGRLQPRK